MVKHSRRARSVHTRPGFSVNQCRSPFEKTLFLPVRNVAARKVDMTPDRLNEISFPVRLRRLLSRPGLTTA